MPMMTKMKIKPLPVNNEAGCVGGWNYNKGWNDCLSACRDSVDEAAALILSRASAMPPSNPVRAGLLQALEILRGV